MTELPKIPVGLATKLGLIGTAVAACGAAVLIVLGGDYSEEAITALVVAGVQLYAVIKGRMDQASAQLTGQPVPVALPPIEDLPTPVDPDA